MLPLEMNEVVFFFVLGLFFYLLCKNNLKLVLKITFLPFFCNKPLFAFTKPTT